MNLNNCRCLGRHVLRTVPIVLYTVIATGKVNGQGTLQSVTQAATRNSERIKIAESELEKAKASLSGTRDVYIPSVSLSSGLGASSGITLNVPTVFTASAQSLVFNYSQRNYVRAARYGVEAAMHSLTDVRQQVEGDTVVTYMSLANASTRLNVLRAQHVRAFRFLEVVTERLAAGYETELEMMRVQKEAAAINLQEVQTEHKVESLRQHLATLTGTVDSVMDLPDPRMMPDEIAEKVTIPELTCKTPADVLSAQADAQSKLQTSFGDARYTLRPQISLQAQYGRISPLNSVSTYYNLHGNYNTLAVGVQIQLPILDFGRRAHAREAAADALKAQHQVVSLRQQERESCSELQSSLIELTVQLRLAQLEYKIAAAELAALEIQANSGAPSSLNATTPKETYRAQMQVGQKLLDTLAVDAQLKEVYIRFLRQNGRLHDWIAAGAQF
ncbi:TolC family protein [Terriglobus sp. RCC_193]|uniref:TolC family protein n=1 Tax=Terriglobus sp. RCC_193 TaxID=3239218 RepID=UPI0035254781